jgi:hypothetical protein
MESNRQSRETDNTGAQDKHGIKGLSIWFRVCHRPPVLSVSLDCLFDSVFVVVHLCCQFLWIVYLIPCLSSFTCVVSFSGLLTTQVPRTNTESNRQSRETDNTGGRRKTRNQIDNPEKLTTQVDEDKDCLFDSCLSSFTCVVSFSGLSIWFRVFLRSPVLSVSLDCLFDSIANR